jgi:multiple sugar transport system permease protein
VTTGTTATVATPDAAVRRVRSPSVKRRRLLSLAIDHTLALALAAFFLTPFFFIVATSLMSKRQALSSDLWPNPFVWSNFSQVSTLFPVFRYALNTLLYAGLSTVGVVVSSVPVAYALSRMQWRGRQFAFVLVLATMMLPAQVTSVPLYVIFVKLGWIGSLKPLIVPAFFGDAFSIFLLRQFFATIPAELSDAARVEGAGDFRILRHVVIPLAKPAIAAIGLFQFLYAWNDFFDPLIYTGNSNQTTFAVALSQLSNAVEVHYGVLWNVQMAASLLFLLPVIILFLFAQRVFIEGVTLTGVKG